MDFRGRDGARLAHQETGEGRPLILIHGHQERGAIWVELGLAARLAARGYRVRDARPRRAVISGQGLESMLHAAEKTGWYRTFFSAFGTGVFEPGSDEQETEDWLRSMDGDPQALLLALDSWVNTTVQELGTVTVPVLVLTGTDELHYQSAKGHAGGSERESMYQSLQRRTWPAKVMSRSAANVKPRERQMPLEGALVIAG
jgi:hypothetical protein